MRGIYSITNALTDTVYIGQSKNISKRFQDHRWSLNTNRHKNPKLQSSWNKYGKERFEFQLVEAVEDTSIDLTTLEQKYKDAAYSLGYKLFNIKEPEDPTIFTQEAIQKISNANKGKKFRLGQTNSEEHRKKISLSHIGDKNPMFGKHWSLQERKEISERMKGKQNSLGHKQSENHIKRKLAGRKK